MTACLPRCKLSSSRLAAAARYVFDLGVARRAFAVDRRTVRVITA